jgi:hypothetical protein
MPKANSWWRLRRHFLRRAFVKGLDPYVWIYGVAAAVFNFGLLAAVGWWLHRLRLGVELFTFVGALIVVEGAFRLLRAAESNSGELREALDERDRPRLAVTVPVPHLMPFDPPASGSGKYATIDVTTTEAVTGCRGHITKITTDGMEIPVRAPIPLRWIAHDSLQRDLVPGATYGMTVVFTESIRPGEFLISTDTHEPRGVPWALNPGVSLLQVIVSADAVPPVEIELRVDATNTWQLLDMKSVDAWERESEADWARKHPVSARLGLSAGGTAPYDDVREAELASRVADPRTTGSTINYVQEHTPDQPNRGD